MSNSFFIGGNGNSGSGGVPQDITNRLTTAEQNITNIWNEFNNRALNPLLMGGFGDGNSHPIGNIYSTVDQAKAKWSFLDSWLTNNPTVDWRTLEADFCAIQECLSKAMLVFIPYKTFIINQPLNKSHANIRGIERSKSKIIQTDPNKAVLITSGVPRIQDVYLGHQSIPSTSVTPPNGVGIDLSDGCFDGATFKNLYIENVTSGIYMGDNTGGHIYSTSFEDIRVTRFRHSALYIGGTGNTGNVIKNFYCVNWNDINAGTRLDATYAVVLKGIDEGEIIQLNIEHGNYNKPLSISGSNTKVNSLHFEGVVANESYSGLIWVDGTNTQAMLKNISLVYSFFDQSKASQYAFLVIGDNARVTIEGFRERNNTVTGSPVLRKFYSVSSLKNGAYIDAKMFHMANNLFNSPDYWAVATSTPVLRRYNDDRYFWQEGGKTRMVGTAPPTSGTWNVGDKIINTAPSAGNYEGWICVQSGTFGTNDPVFKGYGLIQS